MPGNGRTRSRGWLAAAALTPLAAVVALAVGLTAPASSEKPNVIVGTSHGDSLVGTRGADVIKGGGGRDRIEGRGGADVLRGGGGYDLLRGQRGADTLLGGKGGGVLVGGAGRDEFNAVGGKPVGGEGRDVIRARDGRPDVVNCGPGRDVAYVDRVEDGVTGCERVVQPPSAQARRPGR